MKKSEVASYYDTLASIYDHATQEAGKWTPPQEAVQMLSGLIEAVHSILDVGVGTGQVSAPFLKMGCHVCGIDISSEMLAICRRKFPTMEVHEASILDGLRFLEDRSFDVVTAVGFLEFVTDIERAIQVLSDRVKHDGLLCFTFEERISDYPPQSQVQSRSGAGSVQTGHAQGLMHYRQTLDEVTEILELCGIQIEQNHRFQAYTKGGIVPVFYQIVLARRIKAPQY